MGWFEGGVHSISIPLPPPPFHSLPPPQVGVVAVLAVLGVLVLLALLGLLIFGGLRLREKRRTEGTYRPSQQEQDGARGNSAPPGPPLRLPPEERLI